MSELEALLNDLGEQVGDVNFEKSAFEVTLGEIQEKGLHINALNAILTEMLRAIDGADIFTSGVFLELANAGGIGLSLIRYSGRTKYIYSSPVAFSQLVLSKGSCKANTYQLDSAEPLSDVFDPTRAIKPHESQFVQSGMIVSKDHSDILDFDDFEQLPTITLRLTTAPSGNYEWAFDRDTLTARRYSTLLLTESNLCGIFDLLSEVGDDQTEDYLAQYTSHEYHFVRWKAVQSLAALNPGRALKAVKALENDRHPDVRQAVRSTLESGILEAQ